MNLYDRTIMDD